MIETLICRCRSLGLPPQRSLIPPLHALALLGGLLFAAPAAAETEVDIVEEIDCLALNIYFEARGEPDIGKIAVGFVVLNRVADRRFPETVCEVVQQGGEQTLHRCQFSWWCDGQSDKPLDARSWRKIQTVARTVYWGFSNDPTDGALWYHADSVSPYWGQILNRGPKIGQHIFYVDEPLPQLSYVPSFD